MRFEKVIRYLSVIKSKIKVVQQIITYEYYYHYILNTYIMIYYLYSKNVYIPQSGVYSLNTTVTKKHLLKYCKISYNNIITIT